jgi:nicotinate-nucleotide--dimethylbenzimidazole phosphoribosyltransferase
VAQGDSAIDAARQGTIPAAAAASAPAPEAAARGEAGESAPSSGAIPVISPADAETTAIIPKISAAAKVDATEPPSAITAPVPAQRPQPPAAPPQPAAPAQPVPPAQPVAGARFGGPAQPVPAANSFALPHRVVGATVPPQPALDDDPSGPQSVSSAGPSPAFAAPPTRLPPQQRPPAGAVGARFPPVVRPPAAHALGAPTGVFSGPGAAPEGEPVSPQPAFDPRKLVADKKFAGVKLPTHSRSRRGGSAEGGGRGSAGLLVGIAVGAVGALAVIGAAIGLAGRSADAAVEEQPAPSPVPASAEEPSPAAPPPPPPPVPQGVEKEVAPDEPPAIWYPEPEPEPVAPPPPAIRIPGLPEIPLPVLPGL